VRCGSRRRRLAPARSGGMQPWQGPEPSPPPLPPHPCRARPWRPATLPWRLWPTAGWTCWTPRWAHLPLLLLLLLLGLAAGSGNASLTPPHPSPNPLRPLLQGTDLTDEELLEYISESSVMSKGLEEYDGRKSCAITCAKRLGQFLGDERIKDKGLVCQYVISRLPQAQVGHACGGGGCCTACSRLLQAPACPPAPPSPPPSTCDRRTCRSTCPTPPLSATHAAHQRPRHPRQHLQRRAQRGAHLPAQVGRRRGRWAARRGTCLPA
jgi:hypothetical protein